MRWSGAPPHAQAMLMASCGVLVTPHGANEGNIMFKPEHAALIELMPVAYHITVDYFKTMAAICVNSCKLTDTHSMWLTPACLAVANTCGKSMPSFSSSNLSK